jgi:hypothetical protein
MINSSVLALIVFVVLDTWAHHDLKPACKTIHWMCMIKIVKYTYINKAIVLQLMHPVLTDRYCFCSLARTSFKVSTSNNPVS